MARESLLHTFEPVQDERVTELRSHLDATAEMLIVVDGMAQPMPRELQGVVALVITSWGEGRPVNVVVGDEPSLTTQQAAQLLHVSRGTVLRMVEDGTLPAATVPGSTHRRIALSVVADALDSREQFEDAMDGAATEARASGLWDRKLRRAGRRR